MEQIVWSDLLIIIVTFIAIGWFFWSVSIRNKKKGMMDEEQNTHFIQSSLFLVKHHIFWYNLGFPNPLIGNYMIRRLLLVLHSISLIPPIGMFFFWGKYIFTDWNTGFLEIVSIHLLWCVPFTLLILGKYIVYGKFYIFRIEEGEENKVRDSSWKDDSKNSNQDFDDPPFPDGF